MILDPRVTDLSVDLDIFLDDPSIHLAVDEFVVVAAAHLAFYFMGYTSPRVRALARVLFSVAYGATFSRLVGDVVRIRFVDVLQRRVEKSIK